MADLRFWIIFLNFYDYDVREIFCLVILLSISEFKNRALSSVKKLRHGTWTLNLIEKQVPKNTTHRKLKLPLADVINNSRNEGPDCIALLSIDKSLI